MTHPTHKAHRFLLQRYPDRKLRFGEIAAIASELKIAPGVVGSVARRLGFEIASGEPPSRALKDAERYRKERDRLGRELTGKEAAEVFSLAKTVSGARQRRTYLRDLGLL